MPVLLCTQRLTARRAATVQNCFLVHSPSSHVQGTAFLLPVPQVLFAEASQRKGRTVDKVRAHSLLRAFCG